MTADPILTVGMAAYADYDGVFFTVQSLRAHHAEVPFRLLVIDTTPAPDPRTRRVVESAGGRYHWRPDLEGTAAPRDRLFRAADTPWVLCVDSHVLIEPGGLAALDRLARADPDARLLAQGPLVSDAHRPLTHWRDDTHPSLPGVWDHDPRAAGTEPFDIPAQGLGLFAMPARHWPGFHPLHVGFGGEEGYLHEVVRRGGGRCVCLPALRWRHRFRDTGVEPVPYPAPTQDHYFNLLVTRRELGVDPGDALLRAAGSGLSPAVRAAVEAAAARVQPAGQPAARPESVGLVGVWYSDNRAPAELMARSLASVRAAAGSSRHRVRVGTCVWEPVPGNPFPEAVLPPPRAGGHAAICRQVRLAAAAAGGPAGAAGVVFLEHDVLYPADYFDRVGDALAAHPAADGTTNRDYIGLNPTGWLPVRERHHPLHQMALRPAAFEANLARAEADCGRQGWAYLEPADKGRLVELWPPDRRVCPPMPAVHVNHPKRFTSHGEVVYQPYSGGRTGHPYWGAAADVWPASAAAGGCPHPDPAAWADAAEADGSDISGHVAALRRLAAGLDRAAVVSVWGKAGAVGAALLAGGCRRVLFAGGRPAAGYDWLHPIAPPGAVALDPRDSLSCDLNPVDLAFLDTAHTAARLSAELARHAPAVGRFLVVHCTETFGRTGDDGGPGVAEAVDALLAGGVWEMYERHDHCHGLVVLARAGTADR